MGFYENKNIKKGWDLKKKLLYISIAIIIVSILSSIWGQKIVAEKTKEIYDLETIISNDSKSKENKKVKLTITGKPYLLAEKDGSNFAFYIVHNDRYFYIAKMNKSKALSLTDLVVSNGYELVGYTSEVPSEIKEFAIEEYNNAFGDQLNSKLTVADYNNYFGDVCIDLVKDESSLAPLQYIVFYIGLLIGILMLIITIVSMIVYINKKKKINDADLIKLSQEVNSSEAIFFEKGKVYITNNYLVDVSGLNYFKYEDIYWVYQFVNRTNGIVTYKCLIVCTNDGKSATIAINAKDNYEKIIEEIHTRNNNVRIGYTPENISAFRSKRKELKAEKKN